MTSPRSALASLCAVLFLAPGCDADDLDDLDDLEDFDAVGKDETGELPDAEGDADPDAGLDDDPPDGVPVDGDLVPPPDPAGDLTGPTSAYVGAVTTEAKSTGGYGYPTDLRVGGAYLHPIRRIAVPFVEKHGASMRRIDYRQVDVNPSSPTYGSAVGGYQYADFGAGDMRGMASTSVDRGGQIDGVFAYYDGGTIKVFEASGATGALTEPSVVKSGSWFYGEHPITPAVEAGAWGSTSRILLAESSWFYSFFTGSTINSIGFSLLERQADGSYTVTGTGSRPVQPPGSPTSCTKPFQNVAAAYDPDYHEWTVAWMCGSFSVYLQRVNWDGIPVGDPFLLSSDPSDPPHSGVMLSYNRAVDRWLVQFQHNTRVVRRFGASYRCQDVLGNDINWLDCSSNNLAERIPAGKLGTGSVFASEVDYRGSRYFRIGARCITGEGCGSTNPAGHGVSYSMDYLDTWGLADPSAPNGWRREAGVVWWPSSYSTTLHRYVRAPNVGRTALVHVQEASTTNYGSVRVSFVDEASVPVDE